MKKILSVILSFCCFWALSAQTISTKPVTAKPFPSVTPDLNRFVTIIRTTNTPILALKGFISMQVRAIFIHFI